MNIFGHELHKDDTRANGDSWITRGAPFVGKTWHGQTTGNKRCWHAMFQRRETVVQVKAKSEALAIVALEKEVCIIAEIARPSMTAYALAHMNDEDLGDLYRAVVDQMTERKRERELIARD